MATPSLSPPLTPLCPPLSCLRCSAAHGWWLELARPQARSLTPLSGAAWARAGQLSGSDQLIRASLPVHTAPALLTPLHTSVIPLSAHWAHDRKLRHQRQTGSSSGAPVQYQHSGHVCQWSPGSVTTSLSPPEHTSSQ